MEKEFEIPEGKRYAFPSFLAIVPHGGVWLAIAVETGSWIVLDNAAQLQFLTLLRGHTLGESLALFGGRAEDAEWVVTQIEARQLCSTQRRPFKETDCTIELTNACNMRCPHCFLSAGVPKRDELTTDEVLDVLRRLSSAGTREVTLTGGEVSTRADLVAIVTEAKRLGISVNLLTNGTLWSEQLVDQVAPLINGVQISLDGYSEQTNAPVRGEGNFQRALHALELFARHPLKVRVAVTPYPRETLGDEIQRYVDFARQLSDKYKAANFSVNFTTNLLDGRLLKLSKQQREQYRRTMVEALELLVGKHASDYPFITTHLERRVMENCSYGCLHLASNGDVLMCSLPQCKPVANIRRNSWQEIASLSDSAKRLTSVDNLRPCNTCELKYICGGGCRVQLFETLRKAPAHLDEQPTRHCDEATKKEYYDLMIRTNQAIFQ